MHVTLTYLKRIPGLQKPKISTFIHSGSEAGLNSLLIPEQRQGSYPEGFLFTICIFLKGKLFQSLGMSDKLPQVMTIESALFLCWKFGT